MVGDGDHELVIEIKGSLHRATSIDIIMEDILVKEFGTLGSTQHL